MMPFQIFKQGCHTSGNGVETCFSDTQLSNIARDYNNQRIKAPLVLGHPADDQPVYGLVDSLHYQDGKLYAAPQKVSQQLINWVRQGSYKHVSAAFYPPYSPDNPRRGQYHLKHVGFLGAVPPAVKGLVPPMFCDCAGCADVARVEPFAFTEYQPDSPTVRVPAGYTADPRRLALHQTALAYQEKHIGATYWEAVRAVENGW